MESASGLSITTFTKNSRRGDRPPPIAKGRGKVFTNMAPVSFMWRDRLMDATNITKREDLALDDVEKILRKARLGEGKPTPKQGTYNQKVPSSKTNPFPRFRVSY